MQIIDIFYLVFSLIAIYLSVIWIVVYLKNKKILFKYPKMKNFPSVTFLVPAYNEEKLIKPTLEHVPKIVDKVYVIDDASKETGKTWIYCTIKGYYGELTVFNYQGGPAFRDIYPDEEIKKERSHPYKSGVMAVLPGLMGSIQVNECLKILLGFGEILSGKLLTIDLKKNQYSLIRI